MILRKLTKEQWKEFEPEAHQLCFGYRVEPDYHNFSHTLVTELDGKPIAYAQIRELNKDTCYYHFGAVFPPCRGTANSMRSLRMFTEETMKQYKYIITNIRNTNTAMLKLELSIGFVPIGMIVQNNELWLELKLERDTWTQKQKYTKQSED